LVSGQFTLDLAPTTRRQQNYRLCFKELRNDVLCFYRDYLESIYDGKETYHTDQFDPSIPILTRQEEYLETIAIEK
jgi:hypothetical protein